ncbi:hypothetical protein [Parendozoicomonas sp. Alg238-R29]|nr:hypothetical protein [Parendozoicomonas sp. Alg238-R29]
MTENIQTSVTPEVLKQSIISMAIESWRVSKIFDRILRAISFGHLLK